MREDLEKGCEFRRTARVIAMAVGALFSFVPFGFHVILGLFAGGVARRRVTRSIERAGDVPVDAGAGPPIAKSVYVLAGEDSGDLHASNVVRAIRARDPSVEIRGMGGPLMEEAGCRLDFDLVRMNVMGVIPVLRSIGTFFGLFRDLLRMLDTDPPDVLVPVDYPGFNLRAARAARRKGVRVVYYIAPQVWAWAPWRIRRIARSVDRMLTLFPFEREIYSTGGVPAAFVGHPLFEHLEREMPTRKEAGENPSPRVIGLLPGSRRAEVRALLPMMLRAVRKVSEDQTGVIFRLPCRSERLRPEIDRIVAEEGGDLDLEIVEGRTHEVMAGLDLALVASGTASLELAYYRVPMVVMYRIGRVAAFFKRFLLITPHVSLVNIVAGREVVPELVRAGETSAEAADHLREWLCDAEKLHRDRSALEAVRSRLLFTGVADRVAAWTLSEGAAAS